MVDLKQKATTTVYAIIAVTILLTIVFQFVGSSAENITDGADSIYYSNNCSTGLDNTSNPLVFNITDSNCYGFNATNATTQQFHIYYAADTYQLPLRSLFASTGVVVMLLMAGILIFLIIILYRNFDKQYKD